LLRRSKGTMNEPDSLDAWRRVEVDLDPLRLRLQDRHDEIALRLRGQDSGIALANWLALHLDHTLALLRDLLAAHGCPPPEVTVFATGGYGMNLICPRSDIDLLAVYDPQRADMTALARWSGGFQTALRDLGLRVGLAHRAPHECLELARQDLTIATSMLEARPLWGLEHVHHLGWGRDTLNTLIADDLRARDRGRAFARDLLQARLASHKRFGQTVYLLEPDIKSGRGGLRDLHALLWSAHVLSGTRGLHDVAHEYAANPHEAASFCDAADLLYRARAALHHTGARFGNDRLTFPHQEKLAEIFGERPDPNPTPRRPPHPRPR
jgi:[protein-PII] uridylyltransferase